MAKIIKLWLRDFPILCKTKAWQLSENESAAINAWNTKKITLRTDILLQKLNCHSTFSKGRQRSCIWWKTQEPTVCSIQRRCFSYRFRRQNSPLGHELFPSQIWRPIRCFHFIDQFNKILKYSLHGLTKLDKFASRVPEELQEFSKQRGLGGARGLTPSRHNNRVGRTCIPFSLARSSCP